MRFQTFEIKTDERRLLIAGQEAVVGARAFDVLLALASRHGQVVSKQTLLDSVWPDLVVEENNLQVQISTLRKLLGSSTITTQPGRGYCLSAEPIGSLQDIQESKPQFEATQPPPSPAFKGSLGNLPAHISMLYGRDADVQQLCTLLDQHRLITLTGSGGMGKTHLAKTVAAAKREAWGDGVWWLDLTAVTDEASLVQALGQCFRIGIANQQSALEELAQTLETKQLLLVLDNCEHVLGAVKQVAIKLLQQASELQILATSQARLQAPGEYVYQLGTLTVPTDAVPLDQAMSYGAIRLFVERVQQLDRHFALTIDLLPDVIAICQQLDGVALAIELATARVPLLGVRGVHERLGERLRLLGRTADASDSAANRQATMRATLDWSHRLLGDEQAKIFRRLGVFVGSFSLEAAKRLLCDDEMDEWDMLGLLESLVNQSLVVVTDDKTVRYRMLETHRIYALEKLQQANEVLAWQQRLAQAMVVLCRHLVKTRATRQLWDEMNHVRAAYDWAVQQSDKASHEIAIALATGSTMVLAVSGFVHEALSKLLKVESWIDNETPKSIAARYWQWLGRCGVHGRLTTSRCIDAFVKSEKIFQSLNEWRHVHACRRMRAEALLDNHEFAQAKNALLEAQAMETTDWPIADRMRRIKVQALLAGQTGQNKTALRLAEQALALAQTGNIERYVLAIQLDIANLHFKMGALDEALELFRHIASQHIFNHYQRLTIAQARAGLLTVLLEKNEHEEAAFVCIQGIPYWRSSGIFLKHGDLFALWLAQTHAPIVAAQMLASVNVFYQTREIVREDTAQKAHQAAMSCLQEQLSPEQLSTWLNETSNILDEAQLVARFESELRHFLESTAISG